MILNIKQRNYRKLTKKICAYLSENSKQQRASLQISSRKSNHRKSFCNKYKRDLSITLKGTDYNFPTHFYESQIRPSQSGSGLNI